MITLLTFSPAFGEFSASPFCTKAAYLLEMSDQPWQREDLPDPRPFKYGKLPAIRLASGEVICDSENIRTYLEQLGADFDKGLNAAERASARAFVRMADEYMYFHQVLDRWGNDAVWAVIRDTYFDMIPRVLRGFVTGKMRKALMHGMHAQGLGRFSEAERLERLEHDLAAIEARLEGQRFLFGNTPCSADASVASVLGGMRASPVPTAQSKRIGDDSTLSRYIDEMAKELPIL